MQCLCVCAVCSVHVCVQYAVFMCVCSMQCSCVCAVCSVHVCLFSAVYLAVVYWKGGEQENGGRDECVKGNPCSDVGI